MTPTGLVIIFILAPVLVLSLLRSSAAMVFLSLCLGQVLLQFVGDEAAKTVGIIMSDGSTSPELVSLGLLLTPAILTALFMARSVKGKLRLVFNTLPALSVGMLALLLAEPLFSPGLRGSIEATDVWQLVQRSQVIVVGVSAIISLFFLWLQRPKSKAVQEKSNGK